MINNYTTEDKDSKIRSKSCNKNIQKSPGELSKHNYVLNLKKHEKIQKTFKTPQNPKDTRFQENYQMVDQIVSCEKEIKFLNSVLGFFLDINELMKIKQKSYFNEEDQDWVLPNFAVKQKKTVFPKLRKSQIKDFVSNELRNRKIIFTKDDANNDYEPEEMKYGFNADSDFNMDMRPVTSFAPRRCRRTGKPKDISEKAIKKEPA